MPETRTSRHCAAPCASRRTTPARATRLAALLPLLAAPAAFAADIDWGAPGTTASTAGITRFCWQQRTVYEQACIYAPPPPGDVAADVSNALTAAQLTAAGQAATGVYYAAYALTTAMHCLAVWADVVVTGETVAFMFNPGQAGYLGGLDAASSNAVKRAGGELYGCLLGREPVFLLFREAPATWLSTAKVETRAPLLVAARVNLQAGALTLAVRNEQNLRFSGSVRILGSLGTEVLGTAVGFAVQPRGTVFIPLPVRNTTKDEPLLEYILVVGDPPIGFVRREVIECRSGALFRTPGADQAVPAAASTSPPVRIVASGGGDLPGFARNGTILLRGFACSIGGARVSWAPASGARKAWTGAAAAANAPIAATRYEPLLNNRGDSLHAFLYDLSTEQPDSLEQPAVTLDIPWDIARGALVAAKQNGTYRFGRLDAASADATLRALCGTNVTEWSLALHNDWYVFHLDSAWAETMRARDAQDADVRLVIRSRAVWLPPFVPGRAATIQFHTHFPVGK